MKSCIEKRNRDELEAMGFLGTPILSIAASQIPEGRVGTAVLYAAGGMLAFNCVLRSASVFEDSTAIGKQGANVLGQIAFLMVAGYAIYGNSATMSRVVTMLLA